MLEIITTLDDAADKSVVLLHIKTSKIVILSYFHAYFTKGLLSKKSVRLLHCLLFWLQGSKLLGFAS